VHARAQLHELSTHARDSFPKTSLGTKRAIYSRTLNKSNNKKGELLKVVDKLNK
jgi:hypothetical protein